MENIWPAPVKPKSFSEWVGDMIALEEEWKDTTNYKDKGSKVSGWDELDGAEAFVSCRGLWA